MSIRIYLCALLCAASTAFAADAPFTGAGSSAAQPLYNKLAQAYVKTGGATLDYQPVGSSAGTARIKERAVDFGATDVAMSNDDLNKEKLICFPSAISGVVPVVNIPGIKSGELQLTADLLADIFAHKIRSWNSPAIAAVNPKLPLPNLPIVTIVRLDGSGTTYNFADYLAQSNADWNKRFGRGFKIAWPADAVQVKGSGEVAKSVAQTRGAIAYIDYQYVLQEKLVFTKLRNRDGHFVAPSAAGFTSALKNSGWETQGKYEEMLTNKPGAATWPIAMGTFVLVPRVAATPARSIAVLKFFAWGFLGGDALVESANFVRLPEKVQGRIFGEMTKITDDKGKPLDWSLSSLLKTRR